MTTDNTQVGLNKLCEAFIDGDISAGQFKRAVRIWHNKQVEEVLDMLYGELMEEGETIVHQWQVEQAIEAERNRLNPSKSKPLAELEAEL